MTEEEARQLTAELADGDSGAAIDRLTVFVDLLRQENQHQNLVAEASLGEVWNRHIADSAQLLRHVSRETGSWLDLGTGAGFPGIVVACLRPEMPITMVESRSRRVAWLNAAIERLALPHATVAGSRLEVMPGEKYGAISARAFAPLDRLIANAARFSTAETAWVLPKGRSARQELKKLNGWRHTFHVEQSATDQNAGVIVGRLLGRKG